MAFSLPTSLVLVTFLLCTCSGAPFCISNLHMPIGQCAGWKSIVNSVRNQELTGTCLQHHVLMFVKHRGTPLLMTTHFVELQTQSQSSECWNHWQSLSTWKQPPSMLSCRHHDSQLRWRACTARNCCDHCIANMFLFECCESGISMMSMTQHAKKKELYEETGSEELISKLFKFLSVITAIMSHCVLPSVCFNQRTTVSAMWPHQNGILNVPSFQNLWNVSIQVFGSHCAISCSQQQLADEPDTVQIQQWAMKKLCWRFDAN